jgi:hypothetical protein
MMGELLEALSHGLGNSMLLLDKDHEDGLVGDKFALNIVENALIVIFFVYFDEVLSIILRFLLVGSDSKLLFEVGSGLLHPLWHLLAKCRRDQDCD